MANQFLTIKEVARQALPRLIENLVFPNLVYKDYSDTFQKRGDEIQIRKPAKLEAKEFDAAKGVEMQDIDDSQTVTVKLDKIATVDVEISALEGAMNIDNLNPSLSSLRLSRSPRRSTAMVLHFTRTFRMSAARRAPNLSGDRFWRV